MSAFGELAGDAVGDARVAAALVASLHVGRQVRDGRRIAAPVVVEHDDDAALVVPEVVERLVGHAARHGAVADDGDDVAVVGGSGVAGDRHAVRVAEHGGRVAVLHEVVPALLTVRVARHAVGLPQLGEHRLAAGDDLVDVRLVAGVPEDRILRGLEHSVQGERQFDGAEVRTEVSGVLGHGFDDEVADLAGQRVDLGVRQAAEVARLVDPLQVHQRTTLSRPSPINLPVTSLELTSIAEYGSRVKNSSALLESARTAM